MKKFEEPSIEVQMLSIEDVVNHGYVDEGTGGENDLPIMP